MNNMGGILEIELMEASHLMGFQVSAGLCSYLLSDGGVWLRLYAGGSVRDITATPSTDEQGVSYEHRCELNLPYCAANQALVESVRRCCRDGCLLRYTDANRRRRVCGTMAYPLTGTLEEVPGTRAGDLAGWKLTLGATGLHGQLEEM